MRLAKEPPLDTAIRHLINAFDIANTNRMRIVIRQTIGFALAKCIEEKDRKVRKRNAPSK